MSGRHLGEFHNGNRLVYNHSSPSPSTNVGNYGNDGNIGSMGSVAGYEDVDPSELT